PTGPRSACAPRAGSCRRTSSTAVSRRRRISPTSARISRSEDLVHNAVLYRVFGRQEVVAVGVLGDGLDGLTGVLGEDLVQAGAQVEDFPGVDLHVGGLAGEAAHWLVDHDA